MHTDAQEHKMTLCAGTFLHDSAPMTIGTVGMKCKNVEMSSNSHPPSYSPSGLVRIGCATSVHVAAQTRGAQLDAMEPTPLKAVTRNW